MVYFRMNSSTVAQIIALPLEERVSLVEAIWDRIVKSSPAPLLSEAQKEVLNIRIDSYDESPSEGSDWADVKARILKA